MSAQTDADRELKQRHRKMWSLGDYPAVARELVGSLGPHLVDAAAVRAGQDVLDVGAGAGNASSPAAERGANVTASDLTPELFEDGRRRAAEAGAELSWEQADAEALPYEDASFDVVMSCIGAMFAPHHEATASEMVRVCRPGGTVAMANWTPEGLVGELFKVMGAYMPPPPAGATPPPRWGSEDHVRELFGDALEDLHMGRHTMTTEMFETPAAYRDYFKERYGPTIVAYKNIGDDAERAAQLDAEFEAMLERRNLAAPGEQARFDMEYLVLVGRRR
jgi:ubiquinone/menaquinone biosynthesis C-methylase UbiE